MRSRERIARAIVRLYPRAWRVRYEQEMLALIETGPLGWRQHVDLVRGCVDQRLQWLLEPGTGWGAALGPSVAGAVLVHVVGSALRYAGAVPPMWLETTSVLTFGTLSLSIAAPAVWRAVKLQKGLRKGVQVPGLSPAAVRVLVGLILVSGLMADVAYPDASFTHSPGTSYWLVSLLNALPFAPLMVFNLLCSARSLSETWNLPTQPVRRPPNVPRHPLGLGEHSTRRTE